MPITDRLARYDAKGNLSCLVCKTAIAHDALWKAHVLGREHAQAIERLREKKAAASAPASAIAPPAAVVARYACIYFIYLLTEPPSMRNAQCARPIVFCSCSVCCCLQACRGHCRARFISCEIVHRRPPL